LRCSAEKTAMGRKQKNHCGGRPQSEEKAREKKQMTKSKNNRKTTVRKHACVKWAAAKREGRGGETGYPKRKKKVAVKGTNRFCKT